MIPKARDSDYNPTLYSTSLSLTECFTSVYKDTTTPNAKINELFFNQLKNVMQASTLQKNQ